MNQTVPN